MLGTGPGPGWGEWDTCLGCKLQRVPKTHNQDKNYLMQYFKNQI